MYLYNIQRFNEMFTVVYPVLPSLHGMWFKISWTVPLILYKSMNYDDTLERGGVGERVYKNGFLTGRHSVWPIWFKGKLGVKHLSVSH